MLYIHVFGAIQEERRLLLSKTPILYHISTQFFFFNLSDHVVVVNLSTVRAQAEFISSLHIKNITYNFLYLTYSSDCSSVLGYLMY